MRAEALVLCGVSRETPPSLLSSERVLVTLEATQVVPGHPRLHSRRTPRVPPLFKKSPGSPSLSLEEGLFPCFVGEGIPAYLSHLKKRRSPLDAREELQGSCHHFKRPPMSHRTADTPDSPALTRRSPRRPTQNAMAGVTALWPIERKPPIPMVNKTGSVKLLFWVERRGDLHGSP